MADSEICKALRSVRERMTLAYQKRPPVGAYLLCELYHFYVFVQLVNYCPVTVFIQLIHVLILFTAIFEIE